MELDLDALQVLPGSEDTTEAMCTFTCGGPTCSSTG